jgi:hypothetical protein
MKTKYEKVGWLRDKQTPPTVPHSNSKYLENFNWQFVFQINVFIKLQMEIQWAKAPGKFTFKWQKKENPTMNFAIYLILWFPWKINFNLIFLWWNKDYSIIISHVDFGDFLWYIQSRASEIKPRISFLSSMGNTERGNWNANFLNK